MDAIVVKKALIGIRTCKNCGGLLFVFNEVLLDFDLLNEKEKEGIKTKAHYKCIAEHSF